MWRALSEIVDPLMTRAKLNENCRINGIIDHAYQLSEIQKGGDRYAELCRPIHCDACGNSCRTSNYRMAQKKRARQIAISW